LRPRGGDAASRKTRAPLLRLGADDGSCLTVLGVDAEDHDADLVADTEDADPEEPDAIRRGIQELPRRRESVGRGGDISRTGSLPRSMCSRTNSSVRLDALHRGENGTDYFRPTDRRLTEGKNRFGRIVAGYGHRYS
jgi:hypothetical protein